MSTDRPRVLLAHPDMGHRSRLTAALAFAGYHVIEIVSGRALLETIARHVLDGSWRPVVVVASTSAVDPDVSRILYALARSEHAPPVVALGPCADVAGGSCGELGAMCLLDEHASATDVIGAVDSAFASAPVPLTVLPGGAQPAPVRP